MWLPSAIYALPMLLDVFKQTNHEHAPVFSVLKIGKLSRIYRVIEFLARHL
jgi:hypothetical protein